MKKTLVSALTTALVVGAASTTFAAANPFSDVPADHWAYDAVSELASDGIIEGYGDGTYRGQRQITRYEMAQMVAKAMAKSDQADAQTRALIDRLAAEFSDELNNLGVRVATLESKVDNVIWTGKLQYTYDRFNRETQSRHTGWTQAGGVPGAGSSDAQTHEILLRLEPTMTVNEHWKVKARLDATKDWRDDNAPGNSDHVKLQRAYAEGTYGTSKATVIDFGVMPVFSTQGVIVDDNFSGASVTFGKDQHLEGTLLGGRIDLDDTKWDRNRITLPAGAPVPPPVIVNDASADLFGGMMTWRPNDTFTLSGEFFHVQDNKLIEYLTWNNNGALNRKSDGQNIWGLAATYKINKDWVFDAGYWRNATSDDFYGSDKNGVIYGNASAAGWNAGRYYNDSNDHSYNFELRFKEAKPEDRGSFGVWTAYRHLGVFTSIAPTFDGIGFGQKGWEIGGQYTFDTNVVGTLLYARGRELTESNTQDKDTTKLFGRLEFFF
ncbi:hypothetical protein TAMA11512_02650 [Selenomonas sp. TAMA-11512]|uniref:S-layer homology domain-containing protein n=1 Tax=Selenomonas sp. TAMA-11512 TaxID=3095337 RepID=UPI00308EE7D8|nr:hypothetical protein TAMA11512_02650 [Selenomonas sp. TAMA-11512]